MSVGAFLAAVGNEIGIPIPEAVSETIALAELTLHEIATSPVAIVQSASQATLRAGGKRLRPALVVVSALAVDPEADRPRLAKLAACVELVHMATLIHDDVIDLSPLRRGQPTAAVLNGNQAAVLSGDVLLAKAMRLLAQDGELSIIREVSDAVVELATGEVLELQYRGDFDVSRDDHNAVIGMKTASLIGCCCSVGGMAARADEHELSGLSSFGRHVGMAFQIVDDVLDYLGTSDTTGKRAGLDFDGQQATLPLILHRDAVSDCEREHLRAQFGSPLAAGELDTLVGAMRASGAISGAEASAKHHLDRALDSLDALSPSPFRELLGTTACALLRRQS